MNIYTKIRLVHRMWMIMSIFINLAIIALCVIGQYNLRWAIFIALGFIALGVPNARLSAYFYVYHPDKESNVAVIINYAAMVALAIVSVFYPMTIDVKYNVVLCAVLVGIATIIEITVAFIIHYRYRILNRIKKYLKEKRKKPK